MLVIAYMNTVDRLPVRRVFEIIENILSIRVSAEEIMHIVKQLSKYIGMGTIKICKKNKAGRSNAYE
ncbi:hypothetical protein FACI_IFERC00001G0591 [Ferroplasma acidarmanus Fer1]|uniref:Uncharacterized protein n=2 Tax=Ferroplasma TaxID=74968 RepID=S0ANT3_FERAC|nr:hypothetical protein FACI_IFERC00001G0591 [Ferroplasma acidarmanus Fer1]